MNKNTEGNTQKTTEQTKSRCLLRISHSQAFIYVRLEQLP